MNRNIALAVTLAIGGCTNTQVQQAVVDGQLFCSQATAAGPLIEAVATTNGVPVSVIGKTKAEVAALCALINAVPVPPPAAPAAAPVAKVAPTT